MVKRVQLDISRESGSPGSLSIIYFRATFKVTDGGTISQAQLPLNEWEQKQAGGLGTQVVTKFLEIEGCHLVQSDGVYELRVYPTTAMNDEEYKNFLRQAVAAFAEVYGPIDEFVVAKRVAHDLQELFAGWTVPSTDGNRVFIMKSDALPAAVAN